MSSRDLVPVTPAHQPGPASGHDRSPWRRRLAGAVKSFGAFLCIWVAFYVYLVVVWVVAWWMHAGQRSEIASLRLVGGSALILATTCGLLLACGVTGSLRLGRVAGRWVLATRPTIRLLRDLPVKLIERNDAHIALLEEHIALLQEHRALQGRYNELLLEEHFQRVDEPEALCDQPPAGAGRHLPSKWSQQGSQPNEKADPPG